MVWVVKRELTWIPFFGWALKAMNAIALDRGTGRKAIAQLISESQRHMDRGRILMLFPEGTRVLPMQKKAVQARRCYRIATHRIRGVTDCAQCRRVLATT